MGQSGDGMAGYSKTPLVRKLGIRQGARVKTKSAPSDYLELVSPLPAGAVVSSRLRGSVDVWHLFTTSRSELSQMLPKCMQQIHPAGMIWVSWPKRASKVPTDVTEDTIREVALPLGLVDVKVCAVDATWSGLKLMIRKELR
jgi:hypothetical protein